MSNFKKMVDELSFHLPFTVKELKKCYIGGQIFLLERLLKKSKGYEINGQLTLAIKADYLIKLKKILEKIYVQIK